MMFTSFLDYPSEDWAVLIFMSGCEHNCLGCQNPTLQKFKPSIISKKIISERCKRARTNKVVLTGGDPLHPNNIYLTKQILTFPFKFCIYTGYEIDYVKQHSIEGFEFLKCGKYDHTQWQESCKNGREFRLASKNQKLYDRNFNLISQDGVYRYGSFIRRRTQCTKNSR